MSDTNKISIFNKSFIFVLVSFIISLLFVGLIIFLANPATQGILFGLEMPKEFVTHFIALLPGPLWTDVILLYGLPILMVIIVYLISPYTNRSFVKIHSFFYMFRKKPSYGIFKTSNRIYSSKLIFRLIMACLLSFVIAYYLVEIDLGHLFRFGNAPEGLFKAEAAFLGTFFFLPFVIFLFLILWNLEDSGIVAYRIFPEKRKNPDINGVYKIFKGFMEYTIGFSIIIAYFSLTSGALEETSPGEPAFLIPLILFFLPFIVCGILAIPIFLYERFFEKIKNRAEPYLKRKGFSEIKIPEFEDIRI